MGKSLFIAEKPSVAMEFAKALKENMSRSDGYMESEHAVVTWCVGHLVTMSYPEVYDEKYKRWSLDTLPFIPDEFLYEVIPSVKKQFGIVKDLLHRKDVDTIYVCTDSGREGEYIYRLVAQMAGVKDKTEKRVWIDSQTEEEILRGIREAKDLSAYDNLSASAYLRAREDYLMGINFSRLLTLKYGNSMASYLGERYCVISAGRVMTCVLGMVVRREREIRDFVKTPFYRVLADLSAEDCSFQGEWRAVEGSAWYQSPALYKENGFKREEDARQLISSLKEAAAEGGYVLSIQRKTEKKNPPLLYNLAELQNDCSRMYKISPDQTLNIVQELYEKKLVTYPRTDARVLSSAVAKVISRNIAGLKGFAPASPFASQVLESGSYKNIARSRYVNDSQITDHYAIIPTGQGLSALKNISGTASGVYSLIVKRFLSVFYPPAQYQKISLVTRIGTEQFFTTMRFLTEEGYLAVMKKDGASGQGEDHAAARDKEVTSVRTRGQEGREDNTEQNSTDMSLLEALSHLRKGSRVGVKALSIKEGETSPPKRYNSGSMILAMENAGQLIEDEDLREQIKGSGIGTSATRAEILKKLVSIRYLSLNKKTQILSPTLMGEMIYDVVDHSIRSLLNPELTASWEKGLTYVAEGSITSDEYMDKLRHFIVSRTQNVMKNAAPGMMRPLYDKAAACYSRTDARSGTGSRTRAGTGRSARKRTAAGKNNSSAAGKVKGQVE